LDYSFIKAFFTTSENLTQIQAKTLSSLDGVSHINFYGHSEKLVLAHRCESSGLYHFHASYGFCELLDEAGGDITEIGAVGEITGSTIYNVGMPLLRYRTGDYATFAGQGSCACGHEGLSASEILGRWKGDRIFHDDGTFVTTTALNLHSDLYEHIDGLQYVQEVPGSLVIRVIPGATFHDGVPRALQEDVGSKLKSGTVVKVDVVDRLERAGNGKFLLLVSRVEAQ
jgi:phenylacetate-CoA ligase